jgi:hypothetical protein
MNKDTLKVIKLIKEAKGEISYILTRLEADIDSIYAKPVNFAPDAVLEVTEGVKEEPLPF